MSNVSKIAVNGIDYDVADSTARNSIEDITDGTFYETLYDSGPDFDVTVQTALKAAYSVISGLTLTELSRLVLIVSDPAGSSPTTWTPLRVTGINTSSDVITFGNATGGTSRLFQSYNCTLSKSLTSCSMRFNYIGSTPSDYSIGSLTTEYRRIIINRI